MTPPATMLSPDFEILSALDFDAVVPCICRKFCCDTDHPADWWVTLSCGCRYPFCQRALRMSKLRLKARSLMCRLCLTADIVITEVRHT